MPQINASAGMTHNSRYTNGTLIPDFISPSTYKVLIDNGVKDGNGQAITYPAGGFNDLNFPLGTQMERQMQAYTRLPSLFSTARYLSH
jgi:hypothetical protein